MFSLTHLCLCVCVCVCTCVHVCTQVLRLLEDVGLPELVIQLASLAITEAVSDINSQVTSSSQVNSQVTDCFYIRGSEIVLNLLRFKSEF